MYHHHYQIGYSPSFAKFKFLNVTFSIGIIIPLPWLFKIYEIHENGKQRITPIWFRREFPFIKRIIGILGGITFLYLVSILLYALNFHTTDHTYLSVDEVNKNGVYVDSLGAVLGLRTGDKIIKINGKSFEKFNSLMAELYSGNPRNLTIIRNDSLLEIAVNKANSISAMISYENHIIYPITAKFPLTVDSVLTGHNAYNAGLVKGDKIITLNRDTIYNNRDFVNALKRNKNSSVLLGINRNEQKNLVFLKVNVDFNGIIGVMIEQTLTYTTEKKSFIRSLNSGNLFIKDYLLQSKRLFIRDTKFHNIGGFQTIGNIFPHQLEFWRILSMILLIYICWSFIPTPVTESRYLIAILVDTIIRLPRNAPAWIGWIVIISLMVLVNAMDIVKLLK
jgi:regulator of sigma E protease